MQVCTCRYLWDPEEFSKIYLNRYILVGTCGTQRNSVDLRGYGRLSRSNTSSSPRSGLRVTARITVKGMQFNEKEKFFNIYCCKAAPFFVAGLTNYSLCGQKTGTQVRRRVFKYWPPNVMSFLFTFVSLKQLENKLIDFLTGIRTQIVEMNTLTSPIPFTFFLRNLRSFLT